MLSLHCCVLQVLCSVPDVPAALQEIRRVVRTGGKVLFIEHTASPDDKWLRIQQQLLDPLQQLAADGCHLTRNTRHAIEDSGFQSCELQNFSLDGLWVIGPHVAGIAVV